MDYMTSWDYSVTLAEGETGLPPIITAEQFGTLTGGVMSSTPEQIAAVLETASQAVRDWCGWHVAPVMQCEWTGQGEGRQMLLPCLSVRSIASIAVNGAELAADAYEWRPSGVVRLAAGCFPPAWRSVEAVFYAGVDATGAIGAAVAQIAANALAAAPGVRAERIGTASVDYNQTASGVSGGIRLLASDLDLLAPYRLTVR